MTSTTTTHRYTVLVDYDPDSDSYVAYIPVLGLVTQGDSVEHAYEMAHEIVELTLESAAEAGDELPVERNLTIRQIDVQAPVTA